MDQVQPKDFGLGKWTIAHYQDAPPRIVYQCACGKVNALPIEQRSGETGVMLDDKGEPKTIECERKTCEVKDQLTLVAHTDAEMEAAAASKPEAVDREPTPAS